MLHVVEVERFKGILCGFWKYAYLPPWPELDEHIDVWHWASRWLAEPGSVLRETTVPTSNAKVCYFCRKTKVEKQQFESLWNATAEPI